MIYGSVCGELSGARNVSVSVDGGAPTVAAVAPAAARWSVQLPAMVGGLSAHTITVRGGHFEATLSDVLFGDTILCSGPCGRDPVKRI